MTFGFPIPGAIATPKIMKKVRANTIIRNHKIIQSTGVFHFRRWPNLIYQPSGNISKGRQECKNLPTLDTAKEIHRCSLQ